MIEIGPGGLCLYLMKELRAVALGFVVVVVALIYVFHDRCEINNIIAIIISAFAFSLLVFLLKSLPFVLMKRRLLISIEVNEGFLTIKTANKLCRSYKLLTIPINKCYGKVVLLKPINNIASLCNTNVFELKVLVFPCLQQWLQLSYPVCVIICGLSEKTLDMWKEINWKK